MICKTTIPKIQIIGGHNLKLVIDTGASENFIDRDIAQKYSLETATLEKPIDLINADGSPNGETKVNQYIDTSLKLSCHTGRTHQEWIRFYLADLGNDEAILGCPWISLHDPEIGWPKKEIKFTRCPENKTCRIYDEGHPGLILNENELDNPNNWDLIRSYISGNPKTAEEVGIIKIRRTSQTIELEWEAD
jgi:hypothetical protein